MMKGKKGAVLVALGVLLLLSAAGLSAFNVWDADREIGRASCRERV